MKKFSAVFTVVKDEAVLLPIWLQYYSKFFDNIFVIDHHTTDTSITDAHKIFSFVDIVDDRGVDRGKRYREGDSIIGAKVASEFLARLIPDYENVLHAHIDEFVIPNPEKYRDLRDFIEKNTKEVVYCTGYQVIHIQEEEPPMDFSKPLLQQRKYWTKDFAYNKPLLTKKAIEWSPGIHKEVYVDDRDMEKLGDPDLLLVHLHFCDLTLFNDRSQYSGDMNWFRKYHTGKTEIPAIYKEIL